MTLNSYGPIPPIPIYTMNYYMVYMNLKLNPLKVHFVLEEP